MISLNSKGWVLIIMRPGLSSTYTDWFFVGKPRNMLYIYIYIQIISVLPTKNQQVQHLEAPVISQRRYPFHPAKCSMRGKQIDQKKLGTLVPKSSRQHELNVDHTSQIFDLQRNRPKTPSNCVSLSTLRAPEPRTDKLPFRV